MKRFAIAVLFVLVSLTSVSTQAKEFSWTGMQLYSVMSGETEMGDNLFLSANIIDLYLPEVGFNNLYLYAGVRWQPASWLSVAPYVGFVTKFAPSGNDLVIGSLWVTLTPVDWLNVGLQSDFYYNNDQAENWYYYGFYTANYVPNKVFNLGVQCEQTDKNFQVGPHVGFNKGLWHLELQYFVTTPGSDFFYGKEGHALRVVNWITF
jgi:hypothetical protein